MMVSWVWYILSIPALGSQRQVDLSEYKDSVIYRASSKTTKVGKQRNSVLKKQ